MFNPFGWRETNADVQASSAQLLIRFNCLLDPKLNTDILKYTMFVIIEVVELRCSNNVITCKI